MKPNSLTAYKEMQDSGLLNNRQLEVYQAILNNPNQTDRELAEILGQDDSNYVRPRRKALLDLGIIEESGSKKCSISHFTAETWKKKDFSIEAIKKRKEESKKKDSKWYLKRIQDEEKLLHKLRENYAIALAKESNQLRLKDFKKRM